MSAAAKLLLAAALCAPLGAWSAAQMRASELIGMPVQDQGGKPVGTLTEAIVDVREGRLVYAVVGGPQRYYTFPIRALREAGRAGVLEADTTLADAIARSDGDEARFARASRLIGQELTHPAGERIGTIEDFRLDLEGGRVLEVIAQTSQGRRAFPAAVLAQGNFPPLTRWQAENPPSGAAGSSGYLRREPSRERRSLQGPPESR
jgi:sporulation protein YlmC with PRC-barrel domain